MEHLLVVIISALVIVVGLAGYKIGYKRGMHKGIKKEIDRWKGAETEEDIYPGKGTGHGYGGEY